MRRFGSMKVLPTIAGFVIFFWIILAMVMLFVSQKFWLPTVKLFIPTWPQIKWMSGEVVFWFKQGPKILTPGPILTYIDFAAFGVTIGTMATYQKGSGKSWIFALSWPTAQAVTLLLILISTGPSLMSITASFIVFITLVFVVIFRVRTR